IGPGVGPPSVRDYTISARRVSSQAGRRKKNFRQHPGFRFHAERLTADETLASLRFGRSSPAYIKEDSPIKGLLLSLMARVAIMVATSLVALPAHAAKKKTDTDQTKTTQTRDAKGRFAKKETKAATNAPARDAKGRFVKKETDKSSPTTTTAATAEPKS